MVRICEMMEFNRPNSGLHLSDCFDENEAFLRTTHLGIGAHSDDLEFMAYSGIADCFESKKHWFSGVTVTDGATPPVSGEFSNCSEEEMAEIRYREQVKAATIGDYAFQVQLGYRSRNVLSRQSDVVAELLEILRRAKAKIIYLHQPFDRHKTHLAVMHLALEAIKKLEPENRPELVLGCEVWRGLDWMPAPYKLALATDKHPQLAEALHGCFKSQIFGGKRYDFAVTGRWLSNATFAESHKVDSCEKISWALNLTALTRAESESWLIYRDRLAGAFLEELGQFDAFFK